MPGDQGITIERAEPTEESFREIAEFLWPMVREVGIVKPNIEKASVTGYAALRDGIVLVARSEGRIVGSLALVEREFWYGDGTFLEDQWFYVAPDERFGRVGVKLLKEARRIAEEMDVPAFIRVTNPRRHGKLSEPGLYAVAAGFLPFAHVTKLR